MAIRIIEASPSALAGYGAIPVAFSVETRYRVEPVDRGSGGLKLVEEKVPTPYTKDYDQDPGEGPASWGELWDLSHWGILSAFQGTKRAGGTVVAWRTPGINPMEGREEVATLLDIRIAAAYRRLGVGSICESSSSSDWTAVPIHRGEGTHPLRYPDTPIGRTSTSSLLPRASAATSKS